MQREREEIEHSSVVTVCTDVNLQVASLSELLWLKELPKLIILDMFGNPCFEDANYRLHTIFYLKKLKVLDGVPVDMTELNAARDKYAGRITEEWLEEHLGHADFEQVSPLVVC